jgi:outer membrane immunogenic protein
MRKLLLGGIAFAALIAGPATAADLARPVYRRPVVVAAPVYTWTGFYVGGNVGYGWGDANTDLTANGNVTSSAGCVTTGCPPLNIQVPASFAFATSNTARPNGVIGGGQIGYNYQFSPRWLLGFEADIQGSGERASGQLAGTFVTQFCQLATASGVCTSSFPINGTALNSYQAKIDWFGTVRGRLGILVGNQLLIYGTGGLAYGEISVSGNANISAILAPSAGALSFTPTTAGFGASKTNVGFSVGGGMEGRFSYWLPPNWTWKLEYLYLDLGSVNTAGPFALAAPAAAAQFLSPMTGTVTTHTRFTDNIVRVGLNYKFGYAAAPVYK